MALLRASPRPVSVPSPPVGGGAPPESPEPGGPPPNISATPTPAAVAAESVMRIGEVCPTLEAIRSVHICPAPGTTFAVHPITARCVMLCVPLILRPTVVVIAVAPIVATVFSRIPIVAVAPVVVVRHG